MKTDVIIAVPKEPKNSSKDDLMGEDDESPTASESSSDLDAVDSALDDAYEAIEKKDRNAFRDALAAAISAKCEDMYGSEDDAKKKDEE